MHIQLSLSLRFYLFYVLLSLYSIWYTLVHRVWKKGTDSILAVTLTNLDNSSCFSARIILTIRVTEKL